jgi:hypothetical protein
MWRFRAHHACRVQTELPLRKCSVHAWGPQPLSNSVARNWSTGKLPSSPPEAAHSSMQLSLAARRPPTTGAPISPSVPSQALAPRPCSSRARWACPRPPSTPSRTTRSRLATCRSSRRTSLPSAARPTARCSSGRCGFMQWFLMQRPGAPFMPPNLSRGWLGRLVTTQATLAAPHQSAPAYTCALSSPPRPTPSLSPPPFPSPPHNHHRTIPTSSTSQSRSLPLDSRPRPQPVSSFSTTPQRSPLASCTSLPPSTT